MTRILPINGLEYRRHIRPFLIHRQRKDTLPDASLRRRMRRQITAISNLVGKEKHPKRRVPPAQGQPLLGYVVAAHMAGFPGFPIPMAADDSQPIPAYVQKNTVPYLVDRNMILQDK
jgi:hypothetical protein